MMTVSLQGSNYTCQDPDNYTSCITKTNFILNKRLFFNNQEKGSRNKKELKLNCLKHFPFSKYVRLLFGLI